jgi:hypothetical protein
LNLIDHSRLAIRVLPQKDTLARLEGRYVGDDLPPIVVDEFLRDPPRLYRERRAGIIADLDGEVGKGSRRAYL